MAPHSSTLAWKIPWTEEPGRLQSMASLGVGHDWATSLSLFTFMHWRRKWQPTPVFLPGESQGRGEPGGLSSLGSHRVGHDWSDLAAAAWQIVGEGFGGLHPNPSQELSPNLSCWLYPAQRTLTWEDPPSRIVSLRTTLPLSRTIAKCQGWVGGLWAGNWPLRVRAESKTRRSRDP